MNLQNIVSRQLNPLEPVVLTVGMLNSGSRFNVIAENAYMEGTTRCFNNELRKEIPYKMEQIINNKENIKIVKKDNITPLGERFYEILNSELSETPKDLD